MGTSVEMLMSNYVQVEDDDDNGEGEQYHGIDNISSV